MLILGGPWCASHVAVEYGVSSSMMVHGEHDVNMKWGGMRNTFMHSLAEDGKDKLRGILQRAVK